MAHELTHSTEPAEDYEALHGIVFALAQKDGVKINEQRKQILDLYARNGVKLQNVDDIDKEIVADYVKTKLLGDEQAIRELVTQNRSLGQRILNWIDGILARLGSRSARERQYLTAARSIYARVLAESQTGYTTKPEKAVSPAAAPAAARTARPAADTRTAPAEMGEAPTEAGGDQYLASLRDQYEKGEISEEEYDQLFDEFYKGGNESQFSISRTVDNKPFVTVEEDILAGVPEADWIDTVRENLKKKFPNGVTVGNSDIKIDGQSRRKMTFSGYMQWLYNNDPQLREDKLRATNNADEILRATTGWVDEGLHHTRKDRIVDFARGNVLLRVGNNDYSADVVVGTRKNGSMVLYDVLNLQPTSFTKRETGAAKSTNPSPGAARSTAQVSGNSIREQQQEVNGREQEYYEGSSQYSLPEPSRRRPAAGRGDYHNRERHAAGKGQGLFTQYGVGAEKSNKCRTEHAHRGSRKYCEPDHRRVFIRRHCV